jgi:predicted TIM-barrel fold metal-dependent hydrolase
MSHSKVIDADGHIIERSDELRRYLKAPFNKRGGPLTASEPWDRDLQETLPAHQKAFPRAPRAEDWLRVMDQYDIELAFLYPTSMGNVSRVREPDYAVALCEAYNDYVYDHYVKVSERLKPIAIIAPQDPERAAMEMRRAVKQLGYRAAVVRTTGLRLPLGHRFYDPIYREAESLDCAIAVHGNDLPLLETGQIQPPRGSAPRYRAVPHRCERVPVLALHPAEPGPPRRALQAQPLAGDRVG